MLIHIIDNGIVVNTVDDNDVEKVAAAFPGLTVAASETARIGWTYNDGEFSAPPAPPIPVPQSVTMRQARLALLGIGKLADVDAAIDALPSPQKEAARIEWEYSGEVWRDKALVQALTPALGLTEAQVDDLFIQAAAL